MVRLMPLEDEPEIRNQVCVQSENNAGKQIIQCREAFSFYWRLGLEGAGLELPILAGLHSFFINNNNVWDLWVASSTA